MKTITYLSSIIIPLFILFAVIYGAVKKVRLYDSFVGGAKEGPAIILRIFPYILAIFVAIKTFQASGAFDYARRILGGVTALFRVPVEVLSISLIKPLSGSASMGIFTDIVKTTGPDSFASMAAAVIMGSAETTFYVLAIYLGAAGIKKTKYLIPVCIIADAVGIVIAILTVKLLF